MSKIKNQGYTDSSQVLGGASFFALGEREGRQKGTGGGAKDQRRRKSE